MSNWRTSVGQDGRARRSSRTGKPIHYQKEEDKEKLPKELNRATRIQGKIRHANISTRIAKGLWYHGQMGEGYDFNIYYNKMRAKYGTQVALTAMRKYRDMELRQSQVNLNKPSSMPPPPTDEYLGQRVSFLNDDGKVMHGKITQIDATNKDGTAKEYEVDVDGQEYYWSITPDEIRGVFEPSKVHEVKASTYNYTKPKKIKAMLANKGSEKLLDTGKWAEHKWDGVRGFGIVTPNRITLRGRSWKTDFAPRYPEISSDLQDVNAKNAVLDGELVFVDATGKVVWLTAHAKKSTIKEQGLTMIYMVYDILHVDGKDVSSLPLRERRKILERVVPDDLEFVKISPIIKKNQKRFWQKVLKNKEEGIMLKDPDAPYRFKRSSDWLKLKRMYTEGAEMYDAAVMGYVAGKGKFKGQLGSLLLVQRVGGKWLYIGRTSGMDDRTRKELTRDLKAKGVKESQMPAIFNIGGEELEFPEAKVLVKPTMVVEVKAGKRNKSGILTWPAFQRIRTDKPAKEAIGNISKVGLSKAEQRLVDKLKRNLNN